MYKFIALLSILSVALAEPSFPLLAPAPVLAPVAKVLPAPVVTAQSTQVSWRNHNGFAAPAVFPVPAPVPIAPVARVLPAPVLPAALPAAVPVAKVAPVLPAAVPVNQFYLRTPTSYPYSPYSYPFGYRSYLW